MSYELEAFIVPLSASGMPSLIYPLTDELGLVPLTLSVELPEDWAEHASRGTTIARVSAGYFGGVGSQSATVWSDGKIVAQDVDVNTALRRLGVTAASGQDEWDTVGLGRFRKTSTWAAQALRERRKNSPNALAELIEMLSYTCLDRDQQQKVRSQAAQDLGTLGLPAAIPALLQSMQSKDEYGLRISAASALVQLGHAGITAIAKLLDTPEETLKTSDDPHHFWPIVFALGEAGDAAAPVAGDLARMLQHGNYQIRREAAYSLGKIGPGAFPVVPELLRALKDEDKLVRSAAAEALGQVTTTGTRDAVPQLLHALKDGYYSVRKRAAKSLVAIGESIRDKVIPALIELLQDPFGDVVEQAVESLGEVGSPAQSAVPLLIEILRDRTACGELRQKVCTALARINPESDTVLQALIHATRDDSGSVSYSAAVALGTLGPVVPEVVPTLIEVLQRPVSVMALRGAVNALGSMGPAARDALPALRSLVHHEFSDVRDKVELALEQIEG